MARARRFSPFTRFLVFAVLGLTCLEMPALAQQNSGVPPKPTTTAPGLQGARPLTGRAPTAAFTVKLKEPAPFQVYQRDVNGKADIPIVLDDFDKGGTLVSAVLSPNQGNSNITFNQAESKLVGVPAGGPYTIVCQVKHENQTGTALVANVYVGDLWVLAGQSNMEGVGDLVDVTPPNPKVMLLGMDGHWAIAEEPLHWLVDSPDPVHSGDAANDRATRSEHAHKTRKKGAGLGLPFAVTMVESTGVPVGLVACAHGGTSMEQWNPSKKEQGGNSLYGSMLRQVKLAGGKVKGVLWYQGESDSLGGGEPWKAFPEGRSWISSLRSALTSASPSFRSISSRSADSSRRPIPKAGTPFKTPSARFPNACPTRPWSR